MSENLIYKIVEGSDGSASITVVDIATSEIRVIDHNNPTFNLVRDLIEEDNDLEEAFRSMNINTFVLDSVKKISEKITYDLDNGDAFYDEMPLPTGITKTILKAVSEGTSEGVIALAKFTERVMEAATNTSKTALFSWIKDRAFAVMEDGCFIAYKGVMHDENGCLVSIHSGPGAVNGEEMTGHLPNEPGNVLSVGRDYVEQMPGVACGPGLHAGTWHYASSFARSAVLAVKIAPENVISVPDDSYAQKLRVCEYEVLAEVKSEFDGVLY